jgi:hypothetical protein
VGDDVGFRPSPNLEKAFKISNLIQRETLPYENPNNSTSFDSEISKNPIFARRSQKTVYILLKYSLLYCPLVN